MVQELSKMWSTDIGVEDVIYAVSIASINWTHNWRKESRFIDFASFNIL